MAPTLRTPFAGDVGTGLQYLAMGEVFIGTEAVARGTVTRHELARWYRPIYPNVYAPRWHDLSLADRATGAWLWSKRAGIITGVAASALHGADWVDADLDIELLYNNTRPPAGMVARNERIADDEFTSSPRLDCPSRHQGGPPQRHCPTGLERDGRPRMAAVS